MCATTLAWCHVLQPSEFSFHVTKMQESGGMMGPGQAEGNAGVEMAGFLRGTELVMCGLVCFGTLSGNWMERECSMSEPHTYLYPSLHCRDSVRQCPLQPSAGRPWWSQGRLTSGEAMCSEQISTAVMGIPTPSPSFFHQCFAFSDWSSLCDVLLTSLFGKHSSGLRTSSLYF